MFNDCVCPTSLLFSCTSTHCISVVLYTVICWTSQFVILGASSLFNAFSPLQYGV